VARRLDFFPSFLPSGEGLLALSAPSAFSPVVVLVWRRVVLGVTLALVLPAPAVDSSRDVSRVAFGDAVALGEAVAVAAALAVVGEVANGDAVAAGEAVP